MNFPSEQASELRALALYRHVLNVTGEDLRESKPNRDGTTFLVFLNKAVKPHAGEENHIFPDNLPTHHPGGRELTGEEPLYTLPFHPRRFVLTKPDRDLFEITTRQSIWCGHSSASTFWSSKSSTTWVTGTRKRNPQLEQRRLTRSSPGSDSPQPT